MGSTLDAPLHQLQRRNDSAHNVNNWSAREHELDREKFLAGLRLRVELVNLCGLR
jgi:hypothetical protein